MIGHSDSLAGSCHKYATTAIRSRLLAISPLRIFILLFFLSLKLPVDTLLSLSSRVAGLSFVILASLSLLFYLYMSFPKHSISLYSILPKRASLITNNFIITKTLIQAIEHDLTATN